MEEISMTNGCIGTFTKTNGMTSFSYERIVAKCRITFSLVNVSVHIIPY